MKYSLIEGISLIGFYFTSLRLKAIDTLEDIYIHNIREELTITIFKVLIYLSHSVMLSNADQKSQKKSLSRGNWQKPDNQKKGI